MNGSGCGSWPCDLCEISLSPPGGNFAGASFHNVTFHQPLPVKDSTLTTEIAPHARKPWEVGKKAKSGFDKSPQILYNILRSISVWARKKLNLTIDEDVIKAAKKKAVDADISILAEVERYLKE